MDTSLARYKSRRLETRGTPSAIALNHSGDHLAVGCDNGDICFWKLPLEEDETTADHRISFSDWDGVEVSSILWFSDTLATFGRGNGLVAVTKLNYSQQNLSVVNFEAHRNEAIRYISYHDGRKCVATATTNKITTWEFDQHRWSVWRQLRTFSAHTTPALSKAEENAVEITSVHWLRKHKGYNGTLLVSFLHHGVRIIDPDNEQVLSHIPVRAQIGSMSLSIDETMVVINNAHNGFNLYDIPCGTVVEHFVETDLYDTCGSVFLNSVLVHPGSNGVLRVWDVKSRAYIGSVHDEQLPKILAVEARFCKGYDGHSVLATLAQGGSSSKLNHVTVWGSLGRDEMLTLQARSDFSKLASLAVVSAVVATWYLASSSNAP